MENKKGFKPSLICSKCDVIYPRTQSVCPICHSNKKSHSATSSYSFFSITFGGVLFGLLLSIFSATLGLIVFLIMLSVGIIEAIKTRSKLALAEKSGGYWLSEKAQKLKADAFYNTETASNAENVTASQFVQFDDEDIRERSIENFKDSLAVVWADSDISIEFSYRDAKGDRSRRKMDLSEASINDNGELYFLGFCWEALDSRSFKVKRITSKILHNGRRYDRDHFLRDVLFLEPSDFE